MPSLPQDAVARQEAILAAIVSIWDNFPDSGKVYGRRVYADNQKEWEGLCCIENAAGESRARVITVELKDLYSSRGAGRARITHYVYEISIVYQFENERPDEGAGTNSTIGFNALLARGEEAFGSNPTLGFNDAPNFQINQNGLTTRQEAEISEVDYALSHNKVFGLEVTTEAC